MRNISFALTTRQFRDRTKTVTRRRGVWWSTVLRPGTLLCGVEKSQGIKKGGLVRLGVIRVVGVEVQALYEIQNYGNPRSRTDDGRGECAREGFPGMIGEEFIEFFCRHMGGDYTQPVTRIEFEYVTQTACDECSLGVMDAENPHRNGFCRCACHAEPGAGS